MPLSFNKTQFNRENAAKTPYIASPTDGEKHATGDQITFVLKNADETQPITWTFGDGGTASGATATHAYTAPGIQIVTVAATDLEGNPAELSVSVDIGDKPVVAIAAPTVRKWTVGNEVQFGVTATGADAYAWTFGDGGTGTGPTPVHAYTVTDDSGIKTYTVTVTATNDYGSTTATPIALELADAVDASFTGIAEGQYLATGTEISVTAQQPTKPALAAATSYAWDWDDGTTAVGTSATHTFTVPGDYSVALAVDNGHGGSDTSTITIHVGDAPDIPQISAPGVGTYSIGITVTATNTQPISTWMIEWGDGTAPGSTATSSHTYVRGSNPAIKTYTITVTATNIWGTAQATHQIEIADSIPAIITLPANGAYLPTGEQISLAAQQPTELADLATWTWRDGSTPIGSAREITHAFSTGDHTISLEVGNGHGGTNTDTINIKVGEIPTITITTPPAGSKYTTGQTITLASAITGGGTVSWTFGDGTTATGTTTTHTYTGVSGVQTFTVTATVTNHWGTNSDTITIELAAPAVANIMDAEEAYIPIGSPINLTAAPQSDAALEAVPTYTWNLGDGSTKTGRTISHTYAGIGTYTATVTVNNEHGQTATSSAKTIHIGTPPATVTITVPQRATYGQDVAMSATSSGGTPDTVSWTFGDGGTGTGIAVTHTYTAGISGVATYTIVVTAENNYGSASASGQIQVAKPFAATIIRPTANSKNPFGTPIAYEANRPADADLAEYITYTFAAGDGYISGTPEFSHTPSTTGQFTATLTVNNGHGYTDTVTVSYEVGKAPEIAIVAPLDGAGVTAGKEVAFTASVAGHEGSVSWTFGDGGTGTGIAVTHTYAHSYGNTAEVVASATNVYGTTTATIRLQIRHAPFRYISALGEEIPFIDEYCIMWSGIDGMSGITADPICSTNSDIVGELFQKSSFGRRTFTLDCMVYGNDRAEIEANKERLISAMIPYYGIGKLFVRMEDGSEWYINCMIGNGYPRFVNGSYPTSWPCELGFVAPAPCWYAVDEIDLSGSGPITTSGNLPCGGIIVLGSGGATNETTNESIVPTGFYDLEGIEVSTVDGNKYARDSDGNNVLYKIGVDSVFISFAPGQNVITGAQSVTIRPRRGGI